MNFLITSVQHVVHKGRLFVFVIKFVVNTTFVREGIFIYRRKKGEKSSNIQNLTFRIFLFMS